MSKDINELLEIKSTAKAKSSPKQLPSIKVIAIIGGILAFIIFIYAPNAWIFEILFGTIITIILAVVLVVCWIGLTILPGIIANKFAFRGNTKKLVILISIILTCFYYLFYPWGSLNTSKEYKSFYENIAATYKFDIDDFNKTPVSAFYYQPKFVIYTDQIFADARLNNMDKPISKSMVIVALQAISMILDIPLMIIFILVYKIVAYLVGVICMVWAPPLSFLIGSIIG